MVQAWFMDNSTEDQRLPHKTDKAASLEHLAKLGVLYFNVPVGPESAQYVSPELESIRKHRGYSRIDLICVAPDKLPEYETKIKKFYEEHLHVDEEIRFCLEGSGYFDVRDEQDRWIRIEVTPGDLIVLPAGIYHRFTPDTKSFMRAMRLFLDEPVWTPYNRCTDADKMAAREKYVAAQKAAWSTEQKGAEEVTRTHGPNGEAFILGNAAKAKANYPHLRRTNGMLYVSGASSRRSDNTYRGATLQADGTYALDIAEQTRGVIENIRHILSVAGANLSHVVDVTCFLTDMKYYAEFNKVYNEYFNIESGPTRTTVAVKELPGPLIILEIKALAVDPAAQK